MRKTPYRPSAALGELAKECAAIGGCASVRRHLTPCLPRNLQLQVERMPTGPITVIDGRLGRRIQIRFTLRDRFL